MTENITIRQFDKKKIIYAIVIILLIILNIYLYVFKAIPGALRYSDDLRYVRAWDFRHRVWYGVEEYPSNLATILPLSFFPDLQSARIGWMIFNMICIPVTILCFRKTIFKKTDPYIFAIWALLYSGSMPAIVTINNGQNMIFSFCFFMMAYAISEADAGKPATSIPLTVLAGIFLGVSFFKYSTMMFIFPIFIFKRRYLEVITAGMLHVVLNVFSAFWLRMSLLEILISPLTSSVDINAGEGYIDLMAMFNTDVITVIPFGGHIHEFLMAHNGKAIYVLLIAVLSLYIVFLAFMGRKKCEAELVFSLFCALSAVIVYHRSYDYLVLIIPLYYCVKELGKEFREKKWISVAAGIVSIIGLVFILWGDWIFQFIGVSIEYGTGRQVHLETSIIGMYTLCAFLIVKTAVRLKKGNVNGTETEPQTTSIS